MTPPAMKEESCAKRTMLARGIGALSSDEMTRPEYMICESSVIWAQRQQRTMVNSFFMA